MGLCDPYPSIPTQLLSSHPLSQQPSSDRCFGGPGGAAARHGSFRGTRPTEPVGGGWGLLGQPDSPLRPSILTQPLEAPLSAGTG